MTRKAAQFLLGYTAWSFFVWITLVKNIAKDHLPGHGTAFHVVHYVLAAISLVLAAVIGRIGWNGLKAQETLKTLQTTSDEDRAPAETR